MHKPARHVVMSFVSADDATAAVLLLHQLGLASADVASYTPGEMRARAAIVMGRVCPPTLPGLEPELVATQRELARRGHSFVLSVAEPRRCCSASADRCRSARAQRADVGRASHAGSACTSAAWPATHPAPTTIGRRRTTEHPSAAA